jgi:thiamine kinase-like enzyme
VLQSIPGFSKARVISRLSAGPTNDSYELEQGSERFVLRVDKAEAARLGLDRGAEKEVCELLASEGLGFAPLWFDTKGGIYLRRFLPGKTWTHRDLHRVENLARLARLLRRLHDLPLVGKPFEPLQAASRYAKQLGTVEAAQIFAELAHRHSQIEDVPPALCHNDLVCGNILEGRELMLIDWEYAGTGDPFFDLAVVVQHHGLGAGLARHLLGAYLGKAAGETEIRRLAAQCRFYESLLKLWCLRTGS